MLIVIGALGTVLLPAGWYPTFLLAWPVVLVFVVGRRAHGMQDRERFCDQRAVELCGDPEAVIRALEKIHEESHLPRRLAHDVEGRSSHPSLARRIRALRGEDSGSETERPAHGIFQSRTNSGETLEIDGERLLWRASDAEPGTGQAVALSGLFELRLVVRRRGRHLRAVETSGNTHHFEVRADDVARLQAALDQLDGKLAELPKASMGEGTGYAVAFAVAFASVLAALGGAFSLMTSALLMIGGISMRRRRTRTGFAALGAMALLAAAHCVVLRGWWGTQAWMGTAVTGLGGAALVAIAVRARLQTGSAPRFWVVLGLLSSIPMLFTLLDGDVAFRLCVLGRTAPALSLPWVAAGAALLARRRWAGSLLLALGLSGLALGSTAFWRAAADDPFAAAAPECPSQRRAYQSIASVDLPFGSHDPSLSPDAVRYIVFVSDGEQRRCRVGEFGGAFHESAVVDAAFVDDATVLMVVNDASGFALRLVRRDAPETPLWSLKLDAWHLPADLRLSVRDSHWRLFAGSGGAATARLSGMVGSEVVDYRFWSTGPVRDTWRFAEVDDGLLERGTNLVELGNGGARVVWMLNEIYDVSVLRRVAGDSREVEFRTAANVAFLPPIANGGSVLCASSGPGGAALWTYDAGSRQLTSRARIEPMHAWDWDGQLVAVLEAESIALYDLTAGTARRARLPRDRDWLSQIALAGGRILLGWFTDDGLRLELVDLR